MQKAIYNTSIQIKDSTGKVRPAKEGDLITFRKFKPGVEYVVGADGSIRHTHKETRKSPGKAARKLHRAAELEEQRFKRTYSALPVQSDDGIEQRA